ncbi:hypothetical protein CCR75_008387 [Bremia lactucae]|uniref:Protein kinase domain-containing protein n=1 Tax=Bremia lactucae TaxID=4779 RepID=A0A976FH14_BRELC|nr:hypothetical protein CCR75_008387 [Bremia lactucae]
MTIIRNRYHVIKQLAHTTYGGIYLCKDEHQSSRLVALKSVSLRHAMTMLEHQKMGLQAPDDPRGERAFAKQQRTEACLHPHIVEYIDDFIENNILYFVLEYCAGGDLFSAVNRGENHRLDCFEALAVVQQVATGVAYLHSHNIAHRDLSLENVLLRQGVYKIGDFGLATRADQQCCGRTGKAYYMAPEVVASDNKYDPKAADVWSLGIILFILLTGSPLVPLAAEENVAFRAFRTVGVRDLLKTWHMKELLEESALGLLEGMLECDPKVRLTIAQVLNHDAFKRCAVGG